MFEYTVKPFLEDVVVVLGRDIVFGIWLIMVAAIVVALSIFHVKDKRAWEREWNDVKNPDHEFHWIYKKVSEISDEKEQQQMYKRIKRLSCYKF